MILDVPAYVRDGTVPAGNIPPGLPKVYPLKWPRYGDGTLRLTVKRGDLTLYNLTGSSIVLGMRSFSTDSTPLISRQATIIDAPTGRADIPLVPGDTATLVDGHKYFYDIQLTDAAGKRWQVVPQSDFEVTAVFARPADPVTVPEEQEPLALGPSWLDYEWADELQTDTTTTEQLKRQLVWNFDDVTSTLPNLFARLTGMARVSGGTGTVRVRYGGTAGAADGTVLLTSAGFTGLTDGLVTMNATAAKPVGAQLLKITLQNNTAGQRTFLNSLAFAARGAS